MGKSQGVEQTTCTNVSVQLKQSYNSNNRGTMVLLTIKSDLGITTLTTFYMKQKPYTKIHKIPLKMVNGSFT
jgi:hypothetical protein